MSLRRNQPRDQLAKQPSSAPSDQQDDPDKGSLAKPMFGPAGPIRFLTVFVLVSAAGVALEYYLMQNNSAVGYRSLVASLADQLPRSLGLDTDRRGTQIWINRRVLEVTPECSGVEPIAIFIAGVLAFPCDRRKRLLGLFVGLFGVGLLNITRVGWLAVVAGWWPGAFDPWHDALMHMFPLFVVLPLWLIWLTGRGGFAIKFLLCLAAISSLWGAAAEHLIDTTLHATKGILRLAGTPAPFLLMDDLRYWWLAPPVQLFVTLTLVSTWISRRRRLINILAGVCCLWFVVLMDVIAQSSPYLGAEEKRYVLSSILTKGHLIVAPALFWLVLTPFPLKRSATISRPGSQPPGENRPATSTAGGTSSGLSSRTQSKRVGGRFSSAIARIAIALILCTWIPPTLYLIGRSAPAEVRDARAQLAHAVSSWQNGGSISDAVKAALTLGSIQEKATLRKDQHLNYLVGRLILEDVRTEREAGRRAAKLTAARSFLLDPAINPKARRSINASISELESHRPGLTGEDRESLPTAGRS